MKFNLLLIYLLMIGCKDENINKNIKENIKENIYSFIDTSSIKDDSLKNIFNEKIHTLINKKVSFSNANSYHNYVFIIEEFFSKQNFFSFGYSYTNFSNIDKLLLDKSEYTFEELMMEINDKTGLCLSLNEYGHIQLIQKK